VRSGGEQGTIKGGWERDGPKKKKAVTDKGQSGFGERIEPAKLGPSFRKKRGIPGQRRVAGSIKKGGDTNAPERRVWRSPEGNRKKMEEEGLFFFPEGSSWEKRGAGQGGGEDQGRNLLKLIRGGGGWARETFMTKVSSASTGDDASRRVFS